MLENIIKSRLPDVDLSETLSPAGQDNPSNVDLHRGTKRPRETTPLAGGDETSVAHKTRHVAMSLGLLALNGIGSPIHYVGSSSGSFFASSLQERTRGNSLADHQGAADDEDGFEAGSEIPEFQEHVAVEKLARTKSLYDTLRTVGQS